MKELSYLNKYLVKYKYHLILGLLFIIISNVFQIVPGIMVRYAIDLVTDNINIYHTFDGHDIQDILFDNFTGNLVIYALLILLMAFGRGVFLFLVRQTIIVMSRLIEFDLKNDDVSGEVVDRLSKKAGHKTYEAGQVETIHALDWIKDSIGEEGLKARVKKSLEGIKVANYYGCMYTRPRHIFPEKDQGPGSESTSKPHFMDDLLAAAGAENVDFPLKTACCGGAHTLSDSDTSTKLVLNILKAAKMSGADVIATMTTTRRPFIKASWLNAGCFVAAMGKNEFEAEALLELLRGKGAAS